MILYRRIKENCPELGFVGPSRLSGSVIVKVQNSCLRCYQTWHRIEASEGPAVTSQSHFVIVWCMFIVVSLFTNICV